MCCDAVDTGVYYLLHISSVEIVCLPTGIIINNVCIAMIDTNMNLLQLANPVYVLHLHSSYMSSICFETVDTGSVTVTWTFYRPCGLTDPVEIPHPPSGSVSSVICIDTADTENFIVTWTSCLYRPCGDSLSTFWFYQQCNMYVLIQLIQIMSLWPDPLVCTDPLEIPHPPSGSISSVICIDTTDTENVTVTWTSYSYRSCGDSLSTFWFYQECMYWYSW